MFPLLIARYFLGLTLGQRRANLPVIMSHICAKHVAHDAVNERIDHGIKIERALYIHRETWHHGCKPEWHPAE